MTMIGFCTHTGRIVLLAVMFTVFSLSQTPAQTGRPPFRAASESHHSVNYPRAASNKPAAKSQGILLHRVPPPTRFSGRAGIRHRHRSIGTRSFLLLARARSRITQQERLLSDWKIRVIDGDTFAYGAERVRIFGMDAPEATEAGGFEATQRLDLLLHEGPVMIVPRAVDKYGRTVAEVYVNQQNIATTMISDGYVKVRR